MAAIPKIAAVLVVYKQPIEKTETYRSLLRNANFSYLVYDNSPEPQSVENNKGVTYLHNSKNPGVSTAYNEAIKWAKGISASHLLLLDSDSIFPENSEECYEKAIAEFPKKLILPSLFSGQRKISPFYFSKGKSHYGDTIEEGELTLGKQLAINAGTLLPLCQLRDIRFNEKLPLDWSDVDFFRNLAGTAVEAQHIALTVQHGLSEHEERSLASAKFRFELYLKGISIVSSSVSEKLMMYFWAKLRALKMCFQYKTPWFLIQFIRNLYA